MLHNYREIKKLLDVDSLLNEAKLAADLQDFGDQTFVAALRSMTDCCALDADLTPEGLAALRSEIVRHLINRLRLARDLKTHPEIQTEDVSDPIVIIGLPRSGTTKTHRMMANDDRLLKTYMWQLINPAPFSEDAEEDKRSRLLAVENSDKIFDKSNRAIHAAQYYAGNEVHDDNWLTAGTFNDDLYVGGRTLSRSFNYWVKYRKYPSDMYNYQYVKTLFKYLQWQQGGKRERRWLMKNPGHLAYIEELLETYPNATLVHLHRHPRYSIGSVAKLNLEVSRLRHNDISPAFIGQFHLDRAKFAVDRYLEARQRLNLDNRILDVPYRELTQDSMAVLRSVYARAGMVLDVETEAKMQAWEEDNQLGKRGRNVYSLKDFGLSDQIIDQQFSAYIERFTPDDKHHA